MTTDILSTGIPVSEARRIYPTLMKKEDLPVDLERMKRLEETTKRMNDPAFLKEMRDKQDATEAHSVFKKGNKVIAVLYREGGTMLRNEANGLPIQGMMKEAEARGLTGEKYHDFMAEKMTDALNMRLGNVQVETYEKGNAPTQGELTRQIFGTSGYTLDFGDGTLNTLLDEQEKQSA